MRLVALTADDCMCVGVCTVSVHVCYWICMCVCVFVYVSLVVDWNQVLPILFYAFAGQSWASFSQRWEKMIIQPPTQKSKFLTLPFILCLFSGHITLLLLGRLWVICMRFFRELLTIHNSSAFMFFVFFFNGNRNRAVGIETIKRTARMTAG